MSMLIIGVNPPKSCYVCSWYNKVQCPVNDGRYYYRTERHPSCPLVEIPTPHGRLIDGDAYIKMMEEKCDHELSLDEWVLKVCRGGVSIMPTVIEAEGSEE